MGVFDDLLVEVGVFAAAVFARIFDEELGLRDGGRAEGVGLDDVGTGLEEAAVDVFEIISGCVREKRSPLLRRSLV